MHDTSALLNRVLVQLFNDILRIEEKVLSVGEHSDLSIREIHVIEAVSNAGDDNNMSAIAGLLGITVGSLTVSVSTLVRKGYLSRASAPYDRRIVQVHLTDKGEKINRCHIEFHNAMIERIMEKLSDSQLDSLNELFTQVDDFFSQFLVEQGLEPLSQS